MNNDQQEYTPDQQWLAFQYVAGELSEADVESFEQQMLTDVGLCEAVIDVTRLTRCLASANSKRRARVTPVSMTRVVSESPRMVSHSPVGRALAMIVAVCCCGLIAVFTAWIPNSRVGPSLASKFDAEVLLNVWADGRLHEEANEAETVVSLDQDLDVPDWLFAAVLLPELAEGQQRENGRDEDWF